MHLVDSNGTAHFLLTDAQTAYSPYAGALSAKDEQKAQAIAEEFLGTTIKPYLNHFEKTLADNQSGPEYLVGDKPSWADFVVVQVCVTRFNQIKS